MRIKATKWNGVLECQKKKKKKKFVRQTRLKTNA